MVTNTHEPKQLDSQTTLFLDTFSKVFASIEDLSLPMQREAIKEMFHIPENQLEPIEKIENKTIQGRHGPLNVRLFTPNSGKQLPIIVYFHRGGWVYGSLQESEAICRRLANETGSIVVAVEYRLSPEYKFPIPLEDCYDASQWAIEKAATFSGDANKIIIAGESAGGNLAAAVALMLRENHFSVAGQLLMYPVLTNDLVRQHYDSSPDKFLLSYGNMKFFWNMYLSSAAEGENPLASPLKNENFSALPACFIITAEHDALKHEGASYAKVLQKAGVPVQIKNYPEVLHGFLDLPLADDVKNEAIKDIGAWVQGL